MSLDACVHPAGLNDQDLETLRAFGVRGALLVADGTPHPPSERSLLAHFEDLVSHQVPRLERAGLSAWVALGVHPAVLPTRGVAMVLNELSTWLKGGRVLALGLVGLRSGSADEEHALIAQLEYAETFGLRVIASAAAAGNEAVVRKLLRHLASSAVPPSRVLVEGVTGRTVGAALGLGFWAGLTLSAGLYPVERAVALVRRRGPERLVMGSGAGSEGADLLALPRASHLLRKAGLSRAVEGRVTGKNAASFLGVSGA